MAIILKNVLLPVFGRPSFLPNRFDCHGKFLKHIWRSNRTCQFPRHIHLSVSLSNMPSVSSVDEMNIWTIDEFHGVEGLKMSSTRIPLVLKPSDVLVKVSASSVNPIDIAIIGGYGRNIFKVLRGVDQLCLGNCDFNQPEISITAGRDFVGKVIQKGQAVSNVKVDDQVWGVVLPQRQGSHAEYVVTESFNVTLKPDSVSDVEAASIPYVGLTSWSAVTLTGGLQPNNCYNSQVLIVGASGGIGSFITQLLSSWGAEVTGVCSADAFEQALSCGVSEVYDYKDNETFGKLTSYPRFDLIIDAAGFNDVRWAEGLKEWSYASYVTLLSPLLRNTDLDGMVVGVMKSVGTLLHHNSMTLSRGRCCKWAYFMPNETALKDITKLVAEGQIRPVIDKVFKFEDAKKAYKHVQNGPNRGKTVIDFSS